MKKAIIFLALGVFCLYGTTQAKENWAAVLGLAVILICVGVWQLVKLQKQKKPAAEKQQAVQQVVPQPVKAMEPPPDVGDRVLLYSYEEVEIKPGLEYAWMDSPGDEVTFRMRGEVAEAWVDGSRAGVVKSGKLCEMISDYLRRDDRIVARLSDVDEAGQLLTVDIDFWR